MARHGIYQKLERLLIKSFVYICEGLVLVHRHFLKPRNVVTNSLENRRKKKISEFILKINWKVLHWNLKKLNAELCRIETWKVLRWNLKKLKAELKLEKFCAKICRNLIPNLVELKLEKFCGEICRNLKPNFTE